MLSDKHYSFLRRFAKELGFLGIKAKVYWKASRDAMHLFHQVSEPVLHSNFIFIVNQDTESGGNIAKELICDWFSLELEKNNKMRELAQVYCQEEKSEEPAEESAVFLLPKGAIALGWVGENAPVYMVYSQSQYVVVLPWEPEKLQKALFGVVLEVLAALAGKEIKQMQLYACGLSAPVVEERAREAVGEARASLRVDKHGDNNILKVTCFSDKEKAEGEFDRLKQQLLDALFPYLFEDTLEALVKRFLIITKKERLNVTGTEYWLAEQVLPAVSKAGNGGIFQYVIDAQDSAVREKVLGVPPFFLEQNEGVNREAAMHMAYHAREVDGTALGISVLSGGPERKAAFGLATKEEAWGREIVLEESAGANSTKWLGSVLLQFCLSVLDNGEVARPKGEPVWNLPIQVQEETVLEKLVPAVKKYRMGAGTASLLLDRLYKAIYRSSGK